MKKNGKDFAKKIIAVLCAGIAVTGFTVTDMPIRYSETSVIAYADNYPSVSSSYKSIVDALNSIGVDSSFSNRKQIAQANNISGYSGTASQNTTMLNKLKNGTLVKPGTSSSGNSGNATTSSFAGTYEVVNCSKLNVRSSASMGNNIIRAIDVGTKVYVTSITGTWARVESLNGYISTKYLRKVSDSNISANTVTNIINNINSVINKVVNPSYCTPLVSQKTYYISPQCAVNNVLDVEGAGVNNSTNIISYSRGSGNNQKFTAIVDSNGYYTFYDINSGRVIDVSGGIAADARNVQIYDANGSAAQKWRLIDAGGGYYQLQSKINSSFYLDVNGASSANGANVQLYRGNGSSAQKFKFIEVNPSKSSRSLSAAISYADKYAQKRNPSYASYSGANCANFCSQCLVAGGVPTSDTWKNKSSAFVGTIALKNYFTTTYGVPFILYPSMNDIQAGDIIYMYGTGASGRHVMFVVEKQSNCFYANGNTTDRLRQKYSSTNSLQGYGVLKTSVLF
ncbi:MAG: RICIN domain-containing protein [Ruminococcus sp.]|nr:RICIN domain-containing protein [Ruminococcus sp.]